MSKRNIIALFASVLLAFGIVACKPKDTSGAAATDGNATDNAATTPSSDSNPDTNTNTEQQ